MHDTRGYRHTGYISPKKKMAIQKARVVDNIVKDRMKWASR